MNPVALLLLLLGVLMLGTGIYMMISRAFDKEAAKIRDSINRHR